MRKKIIFYGFAFGFVDIVVPAAKGGDSIDETTSVTGFLASTEDQYAEVQTLSLCNLVPQYF